MSISRSRNNPKTGKIEYRGRYYWKDETGKRRDSETGWFPTPFEAEAEARRLKEEKTKRAILSAAAENSKTIDDIYTQWLRDLKEKAYRITTDNTTSDYSYFTRARTLYNGYTPEAIKETLITDITPNTFRVWMDHVNKTSTSGSTIRSYKRVLFAFNKELHDRGIYADANMDIDIELMLHRFTIKPRKYGKLERYTPTVNEVKDIIEAYIPLGLENFTNYYWYTLFTVLFYSGMRLEELVALQFKNVLLDYDEAKINIVNAITERELPENVKLRLITQTNSTKNEDSIRTIPVFEVYKNILKEYKSRFMKYFNLNNKEVQECFVFPNITAKSEDNRLNYQKHKNILRELDRVTESYNMKKTSPLMFRHACATWVITSPKYGGLGFSKEKAYLYFGHSSSRMIQEVYAEVTQQENYEETRQTFSILLDNNSNAKKDPKYEERVKTTESIINREIMEQNLFDTNYAMLQQEIFDAIRRGDKEYHFSITSLGEIKAIIEDQASIGKDLTEQIEFIADGLDDEQKVIEAIRKYQKLKDKEAG